MRWEENREDGMRVEPSSVSTWEWGEKVEGTPPQDLVFYDTYGS